MNYDKAEQHSNKNLSLKQQANNYLFQFAVLYQELSEERGKKEEVDNFLANIKKKIMSAYKLLKKGLIPFVDIEDLQQCCFEGLDLLFNKQIPISLKKRQNLLNERFQAYSKAFKQWEGEVAHG